MKSYEIECKYLIHTIPFDLKEYAFHDIEQGYLCTEPVVRIRKQDDTYYLTYKSKGLMVICAKKLTASSSPSAVI